MRALNAKGLDLLTVSDNRISTFFSPITVIINILLSPLLFSGIGAIH